MLFSETLVATVVVLSFTLLLFALFGLILKSIKKGGAIVSIALILFFSHGHIFNMTQGWQIGGFIIGRHRYLLLAWGVVLLCSFYLILKMRRRLDNLTNFLNVVAASVVVISLVNIGIYKFKNIATLDSKAVMGKRDTNSSLGQRDELPDIYYIILDGYASSTTLEEIYSYDNNGFIDYLEDKGFYVASESRSNYAQSFLSLASSLNMEYVNYLSDRGGIEAKDRRVSSQMIRDSKVMKFLKSKGYKTINVRSGWGPTDHNNYADLNIQCGKWNEFLMILMQTTALSKFEKHFIGKDARKRVLCTFAKLAQIPKIKKPTFVFAHILSPHPPYLFDTDGKEVPEAKLKLDGFVWRQKKNYLNQLIFINKKVKALVDEILSKSKDAPIIILQSDHGSASTFFDPGSEEGWEHPTESNFKERMRIFNAYYLPPGAKNFLYKSITPVNSFRLIFNIYFNTNYGLLPNQSYFSSYNYPYNFINVTDTVKYK